MSLRLVLCLSYVATLGFVNINTPIFLVLQGDGESGKTSKVRTKKPNSRYNEEISSDSETEGLVSDVAPSRAAHSRRRNGPALKTSVH